MNSFFSLLSLKAFRPDPNDVEVPLADRFRKRKIGGPSSIIAISAAKTAWAACVVNFDAEGNPSFGEVLTPTSAAPSEISDWLAEIGRKHKIAHAAVGIGYGWDAQTLSAVPRYNELETRRFIRNSPERLYGETKLDPDFVYMLSNHPNQENISLQFRIKRSEVEKIVGIVATAGLQVVRVVNELAQMIEMAYAGDSAPESTYSGLLVCCPSSYLLLELPNWGVINADPIVEGSSTQQLLNTLSENSDTNLVGYINAGLPGLEEDIGIHIAGNKPRLLWKTGPKERIGIESIVRDFKRSAFDVTCEPQDVVKPLPANRIHFVTAFYAMMAVFLGWFVFNQFRIKGYQQTEATTMSETSALEAERDQLTQALKEMEKRAQISGDLVEWLAITPPAQAVVLMIAREVEPNVSFTRLTVDMEPGTPNLKLTTEFFSTDTEVSTRQVAKIQQALDRAGFRTINIETDQPIPEGWRFSILLACPQDGDFQSIISNQSDKAKSNI